MQTGRPAVFCRFSGCNLWSGREIDRASAICTFCDTDFRGTDGIEGGRYSEVTLAQKIKSLWPESNGFDKPYVVCTGGEPLLQLDNVLIEALHSMGFEVAVETNGTKEVPDAIDWICMSPKPNTKIVVENGNELKLIYPQAQLPPSLFQDFDFTYFFLQPMDGDEQEINTKATIEYCLKHPQWRLSMQTHKYLGLM